MCCSCNQVCTTSHVIFSLIYISIGAIQLLAGVFFFISLPIFRLGSNLWTGGWNFFFGVGGVVLTCVGQLTPRKQQILHYFTLSILAINVLNLVILEIGEFRLLLPESLKKGEQSHNVKFLLNFARTSTSMSTLIAIVFSFLDSQFTFCSIECKRRGHKRKKPDHEMITDADYILPRAKSNPMRPGGAGGGGGPDSNKLNPHYTQSWVFDSSNNPIEQPKTITLKRKRHSRATADSKDVIPNIMKSPNTLHPNSPLPSAATPVVIVEDATNSDRQLHIMTSFSRTPSPVPHSESSDSEIGSLQDFKDIRSQPLYDCLEKLTEPNIYRKRLDSAKSNSSLTTKTNSPPRSVSPRAVSNEQPQYTSLVMELEKTFARKRSVTDLQEPIIVPPQHDQQHRKSDAEFSKELEAALKSIESLESPQSITEGIKSPLLRIKSPTVIIASNKNNNNEHYQTSSFQQQNESNTSSYQQNINIIKDHDSIEVKPWNAKVPDSSKSGKDQNEPNNHRTLRSSSFIIKNDDGRTIIDLKQSSSSLENSPVPNHKSIVQIVEDQNNTSSNNNSNQNNNKPLLQNKHSFKCSTINYSNSLPMKTPKRQNKNNIIKINNNNNSINKNNKNRTKSVGFRLENMSNNVRRAISFNESTTSLDSDINKDEITESRNDTPLSLGTPSIKINKRSRNLSNTFDNSMSNHVNIVKSNSLNIKNNKSPLDKNETSTHSIKQTYNNNIDSHVYKNGINNTFNETIAKNDVSIISSNSNITDVWFGNEDNNNSLDQSYVLENNTNQNIELPNQTNNNNITNHNNNNNNYNNKIDLVNSKSFPNDISIIECNNNNIIDTNTMTSPASKPIKLQSRWSIKSLLRRKPSQPISLPPELEAAFLKSESLIFLSEDELIARYESHKQTLRDIEQRTLKNMKASKKYSPDSDC